MAFLRLIAASLAAAAILLNAAGVPARAEVKRWEGMIDADEGRGLAGRGEFALGCNRRDGLFVMVPLKAPPGDPGKLVLEIDGQEFALAHVNLFEDAGNPVLIAPLDREDAVFKTLRRGLDLHVVTAEGRTDVGLYGAAPLLRDMVKACFG